MLVAAREGIKNFLDSPWSPPASCLPIKRTPEQCGNSAHPYRKVQTLEGLTPSTQQRFQYLLNSEQILPMSRWSGLYCYDIPIRQLGMSLNNKTILHVSDLHFQKGLIRPLLETQQLIRYMENNSVYPDVIVFTGDLITKYPDDFCQASRRLLKELSQFSRHNLFVLGNHDYHGKVPELILKQIEECGFYNLTNSTARLRFGENCINFIGVDDAYYGQPRPPKYIVNSEINIALAHNQDAIRSNFPEDIDLILSGHTHWGELCLPLADKFKLLDGMWWMNKWGYYDNINKHSRHWDVFSERTLSYVHPGLARYYAPHALAYTPGFTLHRLRSFDPVAEDKDITTSTNISRLVLTRV